MTEDHALENYSASVQHTSTWRWRGQVREAGAQIVESHGPPCGVGESCEIAGADGARYEAEVVGFRGQRVLSMPIEETRGVRFGDAIYARGKPNTLRIGDAALGRVLNARGTPIDDQGPLLAMDEMPLQTEPVAAMNRPPIREALSTGIRAIDAMLTVGRGQRMGIFGGSGVGKSTLIGMMTRNTAADLTVVGLVGERGREVREFLEDALGDEGRRRSIVFVSTSDESPLLRIRAAMAATAAAEYFAQQGKHVLLVLDSLTRFAMAAREVGLAAGEPPTTKGYTPSVFARLAKLVERAGRFERGSVTAFYTVLMEGDDLQDPIVDAVRSLGDGHIVLSRTLAAKGWYPPIHILDSLSRLMPAITAPGHREDAATVRQWMSSYAQSEDLIRMGAYTAGADTELDLAMAKMPAVREMLRQRSAEEFSLGDSVARLRQVAR